MKKLSATIIVFFIVAGTLTVGLRPFNFFPKNGAQLLKDKNGIEFNNFGIAYCSSNSNGYQELIPFQNNALTIEIALKPRAKSNRYFAHIFSACDGEKKEIFVLGQWKSYFIIRKYLEDPTRSSTYKEIGFQNLLHSGEVNFISIVSNNSKISVYHNGLLLRSSSNFILTCGKENPVAFILLGNSPTGDQPWHGVILGFAAYDRTLSAEEITAHYLTFLRENSFAMLKGKKVKLLYPFDEQSGNWAFNRVNKDCNIYIPSKFRPIKFSVLVPPWKDFHNDLVYLSDILVNIFGFIPLGFFLALFFQKTLRFSRKRVISFTILFGIGISLTIELLQVYLPRRSSQLSDLINNILGTGFGIALFYLMQLFQRYFATSNKKE